MQPETTTKPFFLCPDCRYEFSFGHLVDKTQRSFGPWYCHSGSCPNQVSGTVFPDGTLDVRWSQRAEPPGLSLLYCRGLYLVCEHAFHNPDGHDYFFHSHACPVTLLHSVLEVFEPEHGGDPHGVLRHVASIPDTHLARQNLGLADLPREPGGAHRLSPSLADVFRIFGTDGQPGPTRWPEENAGVVPLIAELRRQHAADRAPKA